MKNVFCHKFSSLARLCPTLCDLMDCSMPGFPAHHQLSELAQTHVQQVGDAIQLSHPLPSPSPPAFNLSQHRGLFQWVSSSHQVTKVLELQLQHQFFQWIFRNWFPLGLTGLISLQSKELSRVFSAPQFEHVSSSMLSLFYGPMLTSIHDYWKNYSFD